MGTRSKGPERDASLLRYRYAQPLEVSKPARRILRAGERRKKFGWRGRTVRP